MTALAAATLVSLLRADDPYSFFIGGRYAEPVGYLNANCALFLSAFWPAVFLASRRETPWWLRGLFLAAAGFLLEQAILPQSRGSLFVFPVVLVLYVALVPGSHPVAARPRAGLPRRLPRARRAPGPLSGLAAATPFRRPSTRSPIR